MYAFLKVTVSINSMSPVSTDQPLLHILGVLTEVVCRLDAVVVTPPVF